MATEVGSLVYDLSIDDKKLHSQLDGADRRFKDFGTRATNVLKLIGAAIVVDKIKDFGVAAVKAFSESQNVMAQTNAVLKSTGGVAGISADQVKKLANSLQGVTKFSDETVQSGENMLLTFTSIGKDIFPQATETMLDMSQALGQDVKSSAIQLGKALNDPINGVTALRRVGVRFTDSQQDMINKLVESGRTLDAQKIILKELQVEFGGSAKAAGETFAGKLDILKNKFNDVQESIGGAIVQGLTPLATKIADFVNSDKFQAWLQKVTDWLSVNLPKAADYVANVILPGLKNIFDQIWPVIKVVIGVLGELFKFISDNTWVIWALAGAFAAVKVGMAIEAGVAAFQGGMAVVRGAAFMASASLAAIGTAGALAFLLITQRAQAVLQVLDDITNRSNNAVGAIERAHTAMKTGQKTREQYTKELKIASDQAQEAAIQAKKATDYYAGVGGFFRSWGGFKKPPGMAVGGNVIKGQAYIVGEEGREMFIPQEDGRIVPNHEVNNIAPQTSIYGNIILGSEVDVDHFFQRLTKNQELSIKGLATMPGTVG